MDDEFEYVMEVELKKPNWRWRLMQVSGKKRAMLFTGTETTAILAFGRAHENLLNVIELRAARVG